MATQHCAQMKKLWSHMAHCKNPKCDVSHCVSSRYVLSHYRKCKKPCEVCSPVRQAIERHNRRLQAMQNAESKRGGGHAAAIGAVKRSRVGDGAGPAMKRARGAGRRGHQLTVRTGSNGAAAGAPLSHAPVDTKASVCCTMTREEVRGLCWRLGSQAKCGAVCRAFLANSCALTLLYHSCYITFGRCAEASTPCTARLPSRPSACRF